MPFSHETNSTWELYSSGTCPCILLDSNFNVIDKNAAAGKACYNMLCRPGVLAGYINGNACCKESLLNGAAVSLNPAQAGFAFGNITVIPLKDDRYAAVLPSSDNLSGVMLCARLRESLSGVLSVIPVIQRKLDGDLEAEKYTLHLLKSSYLALRTVQNFSVWSRLCSDMELKKLNLSRTLKGIYDTALTICRDSGIEITYRDCAPEDLIIKADKEIFEIAVSNIILNSLLYTRDDNKIQIQLQKIKNNAVITFKDNGKGIKQAALPHIFEPYFSTDPYMDGEPKPGLGIGLSIVMQAATVFGGSCNAEAEFGEGCTLTLTLPCCEAKGGDILLSEAADYLTNRFSVPYVQLSPVCILPR